MNETLVVKIVDLQGDYIQFGRTQGKEIMGSPILEQMKRLAMLNSHPNVQKAEELLKRYSPHLLEEIEGLAEELTVSRDLAMRFSGYDVVFPKMGCTTLVTNGAYIRNYDFSPKLYDARLVFTNPLNGYASVGFSQQIVGRLDGMNEKGLVVGLHFVNHEERAEGFFATSIVRMLLEQCADTTEAIAFITDIPHGYCYNYSITDRNGHSIIVEASLGKQIIIDTNPLICTNHFESDVLREKNRNNIQVQGSIARKRHVHSLLERHLTTEDYYIHFNHGQSPLFSHHYDEFFGTLHTVIYSPKDLKITVGVGNDFKPWHVSLKRYINGEENFPRHLVGFIPSDRLSSFPDENI